MAALSRKLSEFAEDPESHHSSSGSTSTKDQQAHPDRTSSPATDPQNYNLDATTIVYVSQETYINDLNSDRCYRRVLDEAETNLLDQAFLNINDTEKCKTLLTAFINTLIKTTEPRKKKGKVTQPKKHLSNRKKKRIQYTKFQRLSKKQKESVRLPV